MNVVKARAAVEFLARQLAEAMNAADTAERRIEEARTEALAAVQRHHQALVEVERLHVEFLEAERNLAEALTTLATNNGHGHGSANNPTIRIDYPD